MGDYDFFDLTGLVFDPPEKTGKKVHAAIDKAKEELNMMLNTSTLQLERDEIIRKRAFLESTLSTIFNNDGKLTEVYENLAKVKTKKEMENLTAVVSLLKQSGSRKTTNGAIRIHQEKSKLSKEHVEEVFRIVGFTISEIDPLKDMPKFPTNVDKIHAELESLRKTRDQNPNGADLTLATDLYAFAAYLVGEPKKAAEFRGKSTPELEALFATYTKENATRSDNLGRLCLSLATAGRSFVFDSEKNRQAYENYLRYKDPVLTQLFNSMRRLPKSDLMDPKFAEECIRQISSVFGSYEISLAIYNREAGLRDEPYIPVKAVFRIKCHHCQNLVDFTDVSEAQKINKCSNCGKALYKQCKKCNKSVLDFFDKCPECDFLFANIEVFDKYLTAAEQALRDLRKLISATWED